MGELLMRRLFSIISMMILIGILVACSNDSGNGNDGDLLLLEVEFEVPESAEVGENIELKAIVTYGEELVKDAHEVVFEVWEKGDEENSEKIEAENNEDGTYTNSVSFDHDGIYEMYAHTTARDQHIMPKKEIIIGEGGEYDDVESAYHTEGFDMHFMEPTDIAAGEEVELNVHVSIHDEPLEQLNVRYEIWSDDEEEQVWVDAEENNAGEYIGTYEFLRDGKYFIQIHVEDDEELHEHSAYEIVVD